MSGKLTLADFCADFEYPFGGELQKPLLFKFDGQLWGLASDASMLIMTRCELAPGSLAEPVKSLEKITAIVTGSRVMLGKTTAEKVREWCGEWVKDQVVPCQTCGGDGQHVCPQCDEPHDCGYCEGTGDVTESPDLRPGLIRGHVEGELIPLDRNRLAKAFHSDMALSGECEVMAGTGLEGKYGSGKPLIEFRSANWRVLLAALSAEEKYVKDAPILEVEKG